MSLVTLLPRVWQFVQLEIPSRWEWTEASGPGEIWAIAVNEENSNDKKIFIKNTLFIISGVIYRKSSLAVFKNRLTEFLGDL